nr:hypothetical protein OH820_15105 [Streptomyces sp. NBC_00857]
MAILDDMAAYVRAACPEAVYVTFAYYGSTRALDLHGVLGAQPTRLGPCPWLWSGTEHGHPLNAHGVQIESDLQEALAPHDSPAWATVGPNTSSDGNSWLLELPPPNRAVRIAELVRKHHPHAIAVIVDQRRAGGSMIEIIESAGQNGDEIRTAPSAWPCKCDDVITRLVAQVFALPSLADRHLMPLHGYIHPHGASPSDLVRLMPLPPIA